MAWPIALVESYLAHDRRVNDANPAPLEEPAGVVVQPPQGGGGGDSPILRAQIVGFGEGLFEVPNTSFLCQLLDSERQPTGSTFDVFVFSSDDDGNEGREDLTNSMHPCVVGNKLLIQEMPNVFTETPGEAYFCIWRFTHYGCSV